MAAKGRGCQREPRVRYRVRDWVAYDRALARWGDITVWLSPEAVAGWRAPAGRRTFYPWPGGANRQRRSCSLWGPGSLVGAQKLRIVNGTVVVCLAPGGIPSTVGDDAHLRRLEPEARVRVEGHSRGASFSRLSSSEVATLSIPRMRPRRGDELVSHGPYG